MICNCPETQDDKVLEVFLELKFKGTYPDWSILVFCSRKFFPIHRRAQILDYVTGKKSSCELNRTLMQYILRIQYIICSMEYNYYIKLLYIII